MCTKNVCMLFTRLKVNCCIVATKYGNKMLTFTFLTHKFRNMNSLMHSIQVMQIAIFLWRIENAKGPFVHFKCPSTDLKCWSKKVNLHFCRLVSTYYIEYVSTRKLLECQRKEWLFPSFSTFSA